MFGTLLAPLKGLPFSVSSLVPAWRIIVSRLIPFAPTPFDENRGSLWGSEVCSSSERTTRLVPGIRTIPVRVVVCGSWNRFAVEPPSASSSSVPVIEAPANDTRETGDTGASEVREADDGGARYEAMR